MVCPMRGVLVIASVLVAIFSSLMGWVLRPRVPDDDDDGNGDAPKAAADEPMSTAALLSAAARALLDASTGRYLYRQARAAVRAVSASPSPGPASPPRSRRASESSPERGRGDDGARGDATAAVPHLRRRRASASEGLPPLPPVGRVKAGSGGVHGGPAAADLPLTRSRSGGLGAA